MEKVFTRQVDALFRIRTEDGKSIEASAEHPFWVEGRGFVAAKRLARSDLLRHADGRRVAVADVTVRRGRFTVHNFTVAITHTYYAGGWWVHNTCPPFKGIPGMADELYQPSHSGIQWHKVEELADSMRREGWREGSEIMVTGNDVITDGHHRVIAARLAGIPIPDSAVLRRTDALGDVPVWGNGWDDVWVVP